MSTRSQPVRAEERLYTLDVIRGVALLGIFIMNMPDFTHSMYAQANGTHIAYALPSRIVDTLREMLFAGKFNSMFSMLFGLGFALQLGRLQSGDPGQANGIYLRRLIVLFVIGLVHGALLWNGDVLHIYALLGLLLLLLQRAPDKVLIGLIVACLLFPIAYGLLRFRLITPEVANFLEGESRAWVNSNNQNLGHGGFVAATEETLRMFAYNHGNQYSLRGLSNYSVQLFSTMLLGYLAGRRGWLQRIPELMPQIKRLQWLALGIGLACSLIMGVSMQWADGVLSSIPKLAASLFYGWSRLGLMLFYVLSLIRLLQLPSWQARLAPLAIAGRMPLSNYLLQTLMGTFIFYGWGLGYWGQADPLLETLLAIALFFGVQIPLSLWWLKRYPYGPLEYVWRVLTYGRRPTEAAVQKHKQAGAHSLGS
ncbi:DUF418 domain-containing protein [Chitinimonas naiadis]